MPLKGVKEIKNAKNMQIGRTGTLQKDRRKMEAQIW